MKEHVALIILNDNKETLFIQRSFKKSTLPGAWFFPSGTVEIGEEPNTTAIREALEELDIKISPKEIIATKELSEFGVKLLFLTCTIKNNEPIIKEPNEIEKIEWMNFDNFFNKFTDKDIGHGLIWLRQNPEIWKKHGL